MNPDIESHEWLAGMYRDGYFPDRQVDKVKTVLLQLCGDIETQKPQTDAAAAREIGDAPKQRHRKWHAASNSALQRMPCRSSPPFIRELASGILPCEARHR